MSVNLLRVVFNQLYDFLMRHDLLADAQSGFRPCHSTLTALLDITNDWFSNMDNGLLKKVLFLDLKKASILLIMKYHLESSFSIWLTP